MRFGEIKDMLIQVITTWQVIAVSVVVILYFFLVFYVARLRRSARPPRASRKKRIKAAPVAVEMEAESSPGTEGIEENIVEEE
ncbi:MAG: hypothetical protein LBI91_06545 [Spirochaetaceae bacterium]|jgi:heme/copper-type cytochrome/quinol oxidase subunit 2|nr:hypothetical protein [Spirochaetaceae bacterium]